MKLFLLFGLLVSAIPFVTKGQSGSVDARLGELKIKLPASEAPIANYVKWNFAGNLLYTSGHGPGTADSGAIVGRLGATMSFAQGYNAARSTGLQLLATLKAALGNLDRVEQIVKVIAWVNCTDDFTDQPKVVNGFSDLMVEVFGDKGRHARSSIGTNALPNGIPIEIEMVVRFK